MTMTTRPVPAGTIHSKHSRLQAILHECGSVCIGYSGGVDSVFLAKVALDTLGSDRVLAVTGRSAAYPLVQLEMAVACARRFGIPHVEVETEELADPNYAANPDNRCYFCKAELWPRLREVAVARGMCAVLDGSNADDAHDYRPGFAAARENGVRSPLLEAGLTKSDVRQLSRRLGLPTWDQPSSPCLSSRLPYGVAVTRERLSQVEHAEAALRSSGFREFRVRHHGDCVRVEFSPGELDSAWRDLQKVHTLVSAAGVDRVLVDAEGYRRGALNEVLVQLSGACAAGAEVAAAADAAGDDDRTTPLLGSAGQHGDIAVLRPAPLADVRARTGRLRAQGFRYIAVDAGG